MSFGIIRVRTISSSTAVASAEKHNKRIEESKRDNIDLSKSHENIHSDFDKVEGSLMKSIQKRIDETKAVKRKNSIIALEYIVALSPDVKKKMYEPEYGYDKIAILQELKQFVEDKHGAENVLSVDYHLDESNPHAHIIVVPIKEKTTNYKNRFGTTTKTQNRLAARDFIGTKEKLRELQTDFFNHVNDFSLKKAFKERYGVEFFRGADARTSKRKYIKETIREIGDLRDKLDVSQELQEKMAIKESLEKGKKTFEKFDPFKKDQNKGKSM
tara:strand:- start:4483 stop:5295 length:813 start_codon:yes stop_codon:yes gene_type:complete